MAAHLRDRRAGIAKSSKIVARGKGDSLEHGLHDLVAPGCATQPDEGSRGRGVIMRRALAV